MHFWLWILIQLSNVLVKCDGSGLGFCEIIFTINFCKILVYFHSKNLDFDFINVLCHFNFSLVFPNVLNNFEG